VFRLRDALFVRLKPSPARYLRCGKNTTTNGVLGWSLNHLAPRFEKPSALALWIVRLQCVGAFVLLCLTSHTTEWFTNPRNAYAVARHEGAGVWWAVTQALLLFHFMLVLARHDFREKRLLFGSLKLISFRVSPLLLTCLLCALPAYFLGSKAMMLFYFVTGLFWYQWTVRPASFKVVFAVGTAIVVTVFGLLLLQGTAQSLTDAVLYLDYFRNAQMFLEDFRKSFGHTWGANTMSELWYYVPRVLYPAKPKVWGAMAITDVLYPSAIETGTTPGILPWASAYLDFALLGIIVFGLFKGFIAKAAFNVFRARRDIPSLMVFAQIGLITTEIAQFFFTAPLPVFWLWMVFEIVVIRFSNDLWSLFHSAHGPHTLVTK
jgi:hypothetical protein